jgi:hypothetical protein
MELTDEARAEIKAAIDILKSDGVHFTKAMQKHLGQQPPADPKNPPAESKPPESTEGKPPPPKPAEPPAETPKKAGLWWGTKE